jgi:TolB protein
MAQVFISYAREDLSFVKRLARDLKKSGYDVWYDLSGLDGGSRWGTEIQNAIRDSQYVITVLSPDSVVSEWVEREFLFASNLKLIIIPLYYRECELPLIYLNLNYIDVRGKNYHQNRADILDAFIDKPETEREPLPPPKKSSHIGWIALVFLLVIGLGYTVFNVFTHSEPPTVMSTETMTLVKTETTLPIPVTVTVSAPPAIPAMITTGGRWIAFNSSMSGNHDIYMIDVNGENLTQLTNSPAHEYYPSWSPDGYELVFQTLDGPDMELAIVNIKSKSVRKLTENSCGDWGPSWSPDGDWIVFYSNCDGDDESREIYKIRSDGRNRTQLTFTSGQNNWFPSWSHDGKRITFTSNRSGRYFIYTMNADGSNLMQLARGCVSYFSPDGSQILYGVYCNETDAIWLMNADGSDQHEIVTGHECKNATWSPDGNKIVFQETQESTTDGPFALYIMELANPEDSQWKLLVDYKQDAISPVWQP